MRKPELLAPAGDMEKLKYALAYGADAVYAGGSAYGLRAYAGNFAADELAEAVRYTHELGRKIYVTVNIFAHEEDIAGLPAYLKMLARLGTDGIIVSDPGVIAIAQAAAPTLPLHLSTQANTTNAAAANFWFGLGVARAVLARELTLEELRQMRREAKGELEIFVHGAMCMSYSGRCLLSNYLTGRDANRGECTQPCRWKYGLTEETRPHQFFPIEEDERGTYIFNSHDLCLLPYLPLIKPLNIESWKIEGRMKSPHYVASTVKVYREAIDVLWDEGEAAFCARLPQWYTELGKVSHRDYSAGFLFGKPGPDAHNLETSHYVRDYDFVGVNIACAGDGRKQFVVEGKKSASPERQSPNGETGKATDWFEQRGYFKVGETLEILSPEEEPWEFTLSRMWDENHEPLEIANHAKQLVQLELPGEIKPFSILRRKKVERSE